MIDADVGLDPALAQSQVAGVEVLEALVLEGAVMHPRVGVLVGVVDEGGKGQECDAVVGGVVGQPSPGGVLEGHLGADHDRVPVDQLLQPGRLEVEVMEPGSDGLVVHEASLSSRWSGSVRAARRRCTSVRVSAAVVAVPKT